jgi:hypothetical protein
VPPTLVSTTRSTNFGVNNTNKNTPSVAWAAGALIVVHGVAGDNASPLTTPTVTGLTLALVTGYPTNIASRMKHYVWQVAAAAAGSSVFTATGTAGDEGGISVRVYEGHGGLGSTPAAVNNTTGAAQLTFPVSATGSVIDGLWTSWNRSTGARTYLSAGGVAPAEDGYLDTATYGTSSMFRYDAVDSGSYTIGITAPTSTAWMISAVEVLNAPANIDMGGYGPVGMS